jgi:CHAT domain-containing protein
MHNPDRLIEDFYRALRMRDFVTAQAAIPQMEAHLPTHPAYKDWAQYLTGILADERDRDWAKAEQIYRRLLNSPLAPVLQAHVQLSLGITLSRQARWAESIAACEASAEQWRILNYPLKRAIVLRQIALSCHQGFLNGGLAPPILGRAAASCQQALAILQACDASTPDVGYYQSDPILYTAVTWNTLGAIYASTGEWQLAIECQQTFLALCQQRNDRFHAAFAHQDLGDAYAMQGEAQRTMALEFYEQALAIFHELGDLYFEFEVQARIGALYQRYGDIEQALHHFDQALKMVETVRTHTSDEAARSGFFATVVNIYDNAVLTYLKRGDFDAAFAHAELARARTFLEALNDKQVAAPQAIESRCIPLQRLQAKLPADAVLLEFFTTGLLKSHGGRITEQEAANNVLYPTPKTLLFAITQDAITVHELGFSPNTLLIGDLEQSVEDFFLPAQLRRVLYQRLIAPVETLLEGKKRLYVIPHGPLHYVPFHALIATDEETLLREQGPELVYAPSATIIFRDLPPQTTPVHRSCLAIGYNGEASRQLRFAEAEAAYVARQLGGASLIGPAPKKESIFQQAPTYQTLHFSCHGEFDPQSPLESLLHIGPGETLTGQEIIHHLHLNCDLVALSACESGLSMVQRGDELYGLIRAFMYAGAPAILATLWRVDERSTLIFVEKFYQLIQQNTPYATALKEAQLYLRRLTRNEAAAILARHLAKSPHAPGDGATLFQQANKYLESPAHTAGASPQPTGPIPPLPGDADDDQPFADPKYWAPFVLFGDTQR